MSLGLSPKLLTLPFPPSNHQLLANSYSTAMPHLECPPLWEYCPDPPSFSCPPTWWFHSAFLSPTSIRGIPSNSPYSQTSCLHKSPRASFPQWLTCVSCFLWQPFDKKPILLLRYYFLLWTRYFGHSRANLPLPRHRFNCSCSLPCICGPTRLLPHTVLAPRTAAWAQLQGPWLHSVGG